MVRRVKMGGKQLLAVYHKDISHTLMYYQGKKYYLRDVRWRDTVRPDEHISVGISDIYLFVKSVDYLTGHDQEHLSVGIVPWINAAMPIQPIPIAAENDDEFTIRLRFSHLINADLTTVGSAFTIKDNTNITFPILSTAAGADNAEIVFTMSNFMSASGNMTITYNPAVIQLGCLNQGSMFDIEAFNFVFTPDLVPPARYAFENLSVSINPTLSVTQVYYSSYRSSHENISVSIVPTLALIRVSLENPSPL